jgi:uncharacterized protein (DUF2461 family)
MFELSIANGLIGGGLWCPPPEQLSRLRRDIDRKPHRIKSVLNGAGIRKEFFDGIPSDDKKAVHAFVSQSENAANALKSKPKVSDNLLATFRWIQAAWNYVNVHAR